MDNNVFYKTNIPLEELENINEMFFRQVQMKEERALKRFGKQYEETRNLIFSNVKAEGIYTISVSYTHLDVYKRQDLNTEKLVLEIIEEARAKL